MRRENAGEEEMPRERTTGRDEGEKKRVKEKKKKKKRREKKRRESPEQDFKNNIPTDLVGNLNIFINFLISNCISRKSVQKLFPTKSIENLVKQFWTY